MTSSSHVPSWLRSLHERRQHGMVPLRRWILLSLGVPLANHYPWLAVPSSYRARPSDDMSALAALDVEIVIDDSAAASVVQELSARVLSAAPRRLHLQTFGRKPAFVILKKGE